MKQIISNLINNFHQESDSMTAIPTTLNVEVTNICNLKCIMCPTHQVKRAKGFMPIELFKDILPEAVQLGIKQIGLHTVGESVLHPQIDEFIAISKETGIYTYMDTNGNRIAPGLHEKIIDAGLDSLKFSIDASTQEIYEKLRCGGKLDSVIENLKIFNRLRKQKKSKMKLYALFIINKINDQYIDDFKQLVGPYVDEVEISFISNQGNQYCGYENLVSPKILPVLGKYEEHHLCPNPWKRIVISWDGWLTACCIDFELKLVYAKYEKGKLAEAWTNDRITEIRRKMTENDFNTIAICEYCDMMKYNMPLLENELNTLF
jgi:uncharacterized Fe-S cluster-containing radical SAM superfamily enzyme